MKYYNIYNDGKDVLLVDTDKFEIISTWSPSDVNIIHEGKEFEEGDKSGIGLKGYRKIELPSKNIIEILDNLQYDPEKGSYGVMYPNGDWDMYDDFNGVYTKFEARKYMNIFKRIPKLPDEYVVNHWNGKNWKDSIGKYLG